MTSTRVQCCVPHCPRSTVVHGEPVEWMCIEHSVTTSRSLRTAYKKRSRQSPQFGPKLEHNLVPWNQWGHLKAQASDFATRRMIGIRAIGPASRRDGEASP